jgi:hypothetical protein
VERGGRVAMPYQEEEDSRDFDAARFGLRGGCTAKKENRATGPTINSIPGLIAPHCLIFTKRSASYLPSSGLAGASESIPHHLEEMTNSLLLASQ